MRTFRTLLPALFLALATLTAPALAAAAEPPAAVRTIDRGRFTVEVTGEGPDVILIPGLASSRAVWDPLMPSLKGYRVHRVQIAGFAGIPAGPNAEGPVLEPFIQALAAYIREAGLDRPALIGHSMGGFSGLLLAQRHPELVGRLMIVDAAPFIGALGNPSATVEASRGPAEAFAAQVLAMDDATFARGQEGTAAFMIRTPERRADMVKWSLSSDRRVIARAMLDVMTTDARPGLAGMTVPVTVLYAWDQAMSQPGREVPPARMDAIYAQAYAGLPNVKLVRIDGAYHFLMLDQPERFAQETQAFLAAK